MKVPPPQAPPQPPPELPVGGRRDGGRGDCGKLGYETGSWWGAAGMKLGDHLRFWHRPRPFVWPEDETNRPIIMSSLGGLGDLLIHLPLMAGFLQRMKKEERVAFVAVRPALLPLVQLLEWPVVPWESLLVTAVQRKMSGAVCWQMWEQMREARRRRYSLWIDLNGHVVNALKLKMAGVRKVAARLNAGGASFIDYALPRLSYSNEYETVDSLGKMLGLKVDLAVLKELFERAIAERAIAERAQNPQNPPEASLVFGISGAPARAWPLRFVAECLDHLPSHLPVTLVGQTSELTSREQTFLLPQLLSRPGVINRMDLSGPVEVLRTIGSARVVVTPDGGLLHAALAAQVPTIGLFGPTQAPVWTPPQGDPRSHHLALLSETSCPLYPCYYQRGCQRPAQWCMEKITPQEVLRLLRKQLLLSDNEGA